MNTIADLESNIKDNFEGGTSFTLDMKNIIKRSFRKMSMSLNASMLNTEFDLYSGIIKDNPEDYLVGENMDKFGSLSEIESGIRKNFTPLNYIKNLNNDINENGNVSVISKLGFDVVRTYPFNETNQYILIDDFNDEGSFDSEVDTVATSLNNTKSINGSTSIAATFTSVDNRISKNLITTISQDQIRDGYRAIFPVFFDELNTQSIELSLISTNGGQRVISFDINKLQIGLNLLVFNLDDAVIKDTVDDIKSFSLKIIPKESKEQKLYLERAIIHTPPVDRIKFFTDKFVLDKDTRTPKETPEHDSDILRLNQNEYEILIMEASILVAYQATKSKNMIVDKREMENDLARAYKSYQGDSNREEISYNENPMNKFNW